MERLLTPRDLSEMTRLALQTIDNRHSSGGSLHACLKLGNRIRFRQRDVENWLNQQYEACDSDPIAVINNLASPPRRWGRPTKAEQIARRRGEAVEKSNRIRDIACWRSTQLCGRRSTRSINKMSKRCIKRIDRLDNAHRIATPQHKVIRFPHALSRKEGGRCPPSLLLSSEAVGHQV